MRATKLVLTVRHLKLPALKYRRTRGDIIEVFKILKGKYDTNVNFSLENIKIVEAGGII